MNKTGKVYGERKVANFPPIAYVCVYLYIIYIDTHTLVANAVFVVDPYFRIIRDINAYQVFNGGK